MNQPIMYDAETGSPLLPSDIGLTQSDYDRKWYDKLASECGRLGSIEIEGRKVTL